MANTVIYQSEEQVYAMQDLKLAIGRATEFLAQLPYKMERIVPNPGKMNGRQLDMLLAEIDVIKAHLEMAECHVMHEIWEADEQEEHKQKSPKSSSIGQRA